MTRNKYISFGTLAIVVISLFVATYLLPAYQDKRVQSQQQDVVQEITTTMSVVLSIDHGVENKSISIANDATVLDILNKLGETDDALDLKSTVYDGLGTLVESMYGFTNGTNDMYWQYTINDITPQLGASALVPKDGDVIEWSFSAFDIDSF